MGMTIEEKTFFLSSVIPYTREKAQVIVGALSSEKKGVCSFYLSRFTLELVI